MYAIKQKFPSYRLGQQALSLLRRRGHHLSDSVQIARSYFGASELVLSRALCRFNRFDLSNLPASKRKGALRLKLAQWSPYQDSDFAIVWNDGIASVWCWDNAKISADILKQAQNPKSFRKIPETLLQAPENDGLRLVKCLEGVEGQYWHDAELLACRWWPALPDEQAWISFQRDSSIPAELQQASASLVQAPLLRTPWAPISGMRLTGAEEEISPRETAFYTALILCFSLFSVYFFLQGYQIAKAHTQAQQELAAIKKKAATLFAAREEALNAVSRLNALYELNKYPEPLELMAAIAVTLPKDGSFVREWEMVDGQLKLLISSPGNVVGTRFVEAFDKAGLFDEIKIIPNADPKLIGFSMAILPIKFLERSPDVAAKRDPL